MNTPKGEQTIFAEVLRLPPEERAAYLAQVTCGNPELRQEVESLLQSYADGEFLEQSAAPQLRPTLRFTRPITEKAGDRIDRYKLLQQIGEGGCGVVYMAEQSEPVHRRVALKIVKLGMDTKSVIARFEAERQALALMNHPNIAKVFDAGATEAGRPYFVMELVRGTKITEYCDEKKLSTGERLDLFVQVCQAIQHAHQKGIIHRDIKPSNILVSTDDGVAVPKVIDFGVAKATGGQRLTDKTLFTAFEQFIGTPAYMSPEQTLVTNVDIDTRSDIYALGVLLYELLTGKTPFDAKELLAIGLDEMRRTIREKEPERPSTCLSTLSGQELSTTAQRRGLEAPKLVSELRGDLDWIVMKALEKDRARRYVTANGLAMDIQRHLNNEPVVACPPSRLYRLRKTIQRNKLAFAAGAAVATALIVGLGTSTWMFLREREARKRAVAAEQTQRKLREQAELRELNTRAYQLSSAIFDSESAVQARRKALEAERTLLGDNNPEVADSLEDLGKLLAFQKKFHEAEQALQKALAIRRKNAPEGDLKTAHSLLKLAWVLDDEKNWTKEEKARREAVEILRRVRGNEDFETAKEISSLGAFLSHRDRLVEAVARFREAFDTLRKLRPDGDPDLALVGRNLIKVLVDAGRLSEAADLARDFVPRNVGAQPDLAVQVYRLVNRLFMQESSEAAEAILDVCISKTPEMLQTFQGNENANTANAMNYLGSLLSDHDKSAEALPFFRKAFAILRRQSSNGDPLLAMVGRNLIVVLIDTGRLSEATELVREFVPQNIREQPDLGDQVGRLAEALSKQGSSQEAEQMLNECVSQEPDSAELLFERALSHVRVGRFDAAAADFRRVVELNTGNSVRWSQYAVLLEISGQVREHDERCRRFLEKFAGSAHWEDVERAVKASLSLPGTPEVTRTAIKLAEGLEVEGDEWCDCVKGLAEYRRGDYQAALKYLKQASEESQQGSCRAHAYAIEAMAHYRLKQRDLAESALAQAKDLEISGRKLLQAGDNAYWHDWLRASVLLREATALIEGSGKTTADAK